MTEILFETELSQLKIIVCGKLIPDLKNMATFEENKLDYWKALKLISVDVSKQNMVK